MTKKYLVGIIFIITCILSIGMIQPSSQAIAAGMEAKISAAELKVGETITVEGQIPAGQDLFITIAAQTTFKPEDALGPKERKRLSNRDNVAKDKKTKKAIIDPATGKKKLKWKADTTIPYLYYMVTNNPEPFGKVKDKKYGGAFFWKSLYKTKMFKLNKWKQLPDPIKAVLGPIKTEEQWNFMTYAHENKFGINTIAKEGTLKGKIVIFSRSVVTDYAQAPYYWNKGTSVSLDKATGKFKAIFKTFRHTAPNTKFNVFVNGQQTGTYTLTPKGYWLTLGWRYMNPFWILFGALVVGTWFALMGGGGGMLMSAYQVMVIHTAGPMGINAANTLKPSNTPLTLFSAIGGMYQYAIKDRRVAWPLALSFGVGIFIGAFYLGPNFSAKYLPMSTYKHWLGILTLIMGVRLLYELTPAVMEKRKSIKAIVAKFNEEVKQAREEGRSAQMGRIETIKGGLGSIFSTYEFKFWGESFSIRPWVFGLIGIFVGVVASSFGIGGGFLLVPIMTTLAALPMYMAVPASLVGTMFSSICSIAGYIILGYYPDLTIATCIVVGALVGGVIGSRLQGFFTEKQLKWALAILMFFLFFRFTGTEIWI
ncbi:MAG: sulfite exporter TauE/SafE family protein [Desulfobacterales bacterium]|nr:sulfite exporter TauE/SafE family protein [Desulfobacterales bacterium]